MVLTIQQATAASESFASDTLYQLSMFIRASYILDHTSVVTHLGFVQALFVTRILHYCFHHFGTFACNPHHGSVFSAACGCGNSVVHPGSDWMGCGCDTVDWRILGEALQLLMFFMSF